MVVCPTFSSPYRGGFCQAENPIGIQVSWGRHRGIEGKLLDHPYSVIWFDLNWKVKVSVQPASPSKPPPVSAQRFAALLSCSWEIFYLTVSFWLSLEPQSLCSLVLSLHPLTGFVYSLWMGLQWSATEPRLPLYVSPVVMDLRLELINKKIRIIVLIYSFSALTDYLYL